MNQIQHTRTSSMLCVRNCAQGWLAVDLCNEVKSCMSCSWVRNRDMQFIGIALELTTVLSEFLPAPYGEAWKRGAPHTQAISTKLSIQILNLNAPGLPPALNPNTFIWGGDDQGNLLISSGRSWNHK